MRLVTLFLAWFILFLSLVFVPGHAFAQPDIDSLKTQLLKASDEEKLKILLRIADTLSATEPSEAIKYAKDAEMLALEDDYESAAGESYILQGKINNHLGRFATAIERLGTAEKFFTALGDEKKLAGTYYLLGESYRLIDDTGKALNYNLKTLEIFEKIRDTLGIITAFNNIGIFYDRQKQYADAITYYERGVDIIIRKQKKGRRDSIYVGHAYIRIATEYIQLQDFENANRCIDQAKDLNKSIGDKLLSAGIYLNRGAIHRMQKKYTKALSCFESALTLFEKMEDLNGVSLSYRNIGEIMNLRGRREEAVSYYLNAIRAAEEIRNLDLISQSGRQLSSIFAKQGNYEQAYYYYVVSARAQDSLQNGEKATQIREMQALFQSQQEAKEAEIRKQNRINTLLLGGFALLFGGYFVYSLRIRIRKDRQITSRKQMLPFAQRAVYGD
jgi:tetratricopeptide (TPR) repeat protein